MSEESTIAAPPPASAPSNSGLESTGSNMNNALDIGLNNLFKRAPQDDGGDNHQSNEESEVKAEPKKQIANEEKEKNFTKKDEPEYKESSSDEFPDEPSKANPKGNWKTIKTALQEARKSVWHKEREIETLKKTLASSKDLTKKEVEDLKKQNEELSGYRSMVDAHADPKFLEQFENPIEKVANKMRSLLVQAGGKKEVLDLLNTDQLVDRNNLNGWRKVLQEMGDGLTADEIISMARQISDIKEKKSEFLEDRKKNFKTHVETEKKKSFESKAAFEGSVLSKVSEIASMKDEEGNPKFAFLNERTIEDGSTPEQAKEVEKHNQMVQSVNSEIKNFLKENDPIATAHMVTLAIASQFMNSELNQSRQEIKALKERLGKLGKVNSEKGSTTNTRSVSNGDENRAPSTNTAKNVDDALSSHFGNRYKKSVL